MIKVFSFRKNFFWVFNPIDIINLKNVFRLEGKVMYDFNFFQKPMLALELYPEEVYVGIEFGFLRIRTYDSNLFPTKTEILKNFFSSQFSDKKFSLNYKLIGKNFFIKKWRETMLIIFRSMKKIPRNERERKKLVKSQNSNKKKKNKINLNHFFSSQTFIKFNEILVFRDLWQKGLVISNGIKFGSTFTVYSGYVGFFHSFASIYVINPFSNFFLIDLISFGRIGTSTKKRTIISFLTRKLFVKYFGIKWLNDLP
jgi:tRNA splicing endonuclease